MRLLAICPHCTAQQWHSVLGCSACGVRPTTHGVPYMGDVFWDADERLWTFLLLDAEGNQLGDAQYCANLPDIERLAQKDCAAVGVYSYTLTNTRGTCYPKKVKNQ